MYGDWTDISQWPQVPGTAAIEKRRLAKQMFFTGTADGVVDGFRRGFDAMAYSLDAALFIQGVKRDVEDIRSRL